LLFEKLIFRSSQSVHGSVLRTCKKKKEARHGELLSDLGELTVSPWRLTISVRRVNISSWRFEYENGRYYSFYSREIILFSSLQLPPSGSRWAYS